MLSSLTHSLIQTLQYYSQLVPLPWFVFFGALIEEVIAPIPSPIVMTIAGSIAQGQSLGFLAILALALIGAVGKTLGSYLVYIVADKAEDIVLTKFGKFIGVSHREVESFGKHLNQGRRDDFVLFLLRAIPIVPTAPVSVVCGLIKLNLRTYLVSTFFGTLVRNAFYLYLGFTSVGALESINSGLDDLETFGYLFLFILFAIGFLAIVNHKRKGAKLDILHRLFPQQKDQD